MEVQRLYRSGSKCGEMQCGLVHIHNLNSVFDGREEWLAELGRHIHPKKKAIVVTGGGQSFAKKYLTSISGFFARHFGKLYAEKVGETAAGGTIWLVGRNHY